MMTEENMFGRKTLKVLISDEMNGHHLFLLKCYAESLKSVEFFSKFNLDKLSDFIEEHAIEMAIVFLYERKGIYKLMTIFEQKLPIIICAHQKEIWWLEELLPDVSLIDMGLPKHELFSKIDTFLFKG